MKTLRVECGGWRSKPIPCEIEMDPFRPGEAICVKVYPLETTVVTVPERGRPILRAYDDDGKEIAWVEVGSWMMQSRDTLTLQGRDPL